MIGPGRTTAPQRVSRAAPPAPRAPAVPRRAAMAARAPRRGARAAAAGAAAPAAAPGARRMAAEWLRMDPDAASRAKVEAMLAVGDEAALEDLMCQRLEFGGRPRGEGGRRLG
jgi:hypothetical protein